MSGSMGRWGAWEDAAEAEAWMGEQELHMMGQEKAKVRARTELRLSLPPTPHPDP